MRIVRYKCAFVNGSSLDPTRLRANSAFHQVRLMGLSAASVPSVSQAERCRTHSGRRFALHTVAHPQNGAVPFGNLGNCDSSYRVAGEMVKGAHDRPNATFQGRDIGLLGIDHLFTVYRFPNRHGYTNGRCSIRNITLCGPVAVSKHVAYQLAL